MLKTSLPQPPLSRFRLICIGSSLSYSARRESGHPAREEYVIVEEGERDKPTSERPLTYLHPLHPFASPPLSSGIDNCWVTP